MQTYCRCGGKVSRVEKNNLGTVFVCSFGGTQYSVNGCRRSYLSDRDLTAHQLHRHEKTPPRQPASVAAADESKSVVGGTQVGYTCVVLAIKFSCNEINTHINRTRGTLSTALVMLGESGKLCPQVFICDEA